MTSRSKTPSTYNGHTEQKQQQKYPRPQPARGTTTGVRRYISQQESRQHHQGRTTTRRRPISPPSHNNNNNKEMAYHEISRPKARGSQSSLHDYSNDVGYDFLSSSTDPLACLAGPHISGKPTVLTARAQRSVGQVRTPVPGSPKDKAKSKKRKLDQRQQPLEQALELQRDNMAGRIQPSNGYKPVQDHFPLPGEHDLNREQQRKKWSMEKLATPVDMNQPIPRKNTAPVDLCDHGSDTDTVTEEVQVIPNNNLPAAKMDRPVSCGSTSQLKLTKRKGDSRPLSPFTGASADLVGLSPSVLRAQNGNARRPSVSKSEQPWSPGSAVLELEEGHQARKLVDMISNAGDPDNTFTQSAGRSVNICDGVDSPPRAVADTSGWRTSVSAITGAVGRMFGKGSRTGKHRNRKQAAYIIPGATFGNSSQRAEDQDSTPESFQASFHRSRKDDEEEYVPSSLKGVNEANPGSFPDSSHRLSTRIRMATTRPDSAHKVLINMADSDSEDEMQQAILMPSVAPEFDALSVTFGERDQSSCKISPNSATSLRISYERLGKVRKCQEVDIQWQEINQLKYYYRKKGCLDDFLALEVEVTKSNLLARFQDGAKSLWVVVKFSSSEILTRLLDAMKERPSLSIFLGNNHTLSEADASRLLNDISSGWNTSGRTRSMRKRLTAQERLKTDSILLVYPFDGDATAMEQAAAGLKEAKGDSDVFSDLHVAAGKIDVEGHGDSAESETDEEEKQGRAHRLTIRETDVERLQVGEFLNDTLIDFWMQWIFRRSDRSNIHIFTSHFYSQLEKGADEVTSWTEKKGIDVFQKKFIFIPINESSHWSLCVVVNPGSIMESVRSSESKEQKSDSPLACLLFFDSLRAHPIRKAAKNVRGWLNSEWARLRSSTCIDKPFQIKSMEAFAPRIPYQNNSWDCGVFVCRYAYAMYLLRNEEFSYGSTGISENKPFERLVSDSKEFNFTMKDIRRMRQDMKVLIERLSELYAKWKEERDRKEAERRAKKKNSPPNAPAFNSTVEATQDIVMTDSNSSFPVSDRGNSVQVQSSVSSPTREVRPGLTVEGVVYDSSLAVGTRCREAIELLDSDEQQPMNSQQSQQYEGTLETDHI